MPSPTKIRYAGHHNTDGLASIEQVSVLIAKSTRPSAVFKQRLSQVAGMVLAKPVRATRDSPPFDKAMVDGYAVRAADLATVLAPLVVSGEVAAGDRKALPLAAKSAVRINTGAALPKGADAVVMVEDTLTIPSAKSVRMTKAVRSGENVAPRGRDGKKGDVILNAPVRMSPARIAAAATAGAAAVSVYRRPRLALLVTGNEVVPPGGRVAATAIFNSNGPSLAALADLCGADVVNHGICRDNRALLAKRLGSALASPIIVVVGGMSMGTLDLVPDALGKLGVRWKVHGVAIRPGRPMGFGIGPKGQLVFGLPGNPVSCFVCFRLFVRQAIDAMQGLRTPTPTRFSAQLTATLKASRDTRPAFLPAQWTIDADGRSCIAPVAWQGSGDSLGLGRANALLCQQAGRGIPAGSEVKFIPLELPE